MELTIRPVNTDEYNATERLAYEAFQDRSRLPGDFCDEHYLLHLLRASDAYVPELDFVAYAAEELVGQITYSYCTLRRQGGSTQQVLTFGPLSVHPAWQSKGVGSLLVQATLEAAKKQGHGAVVLFGHLEYYPRFGFVPAERFGISTAEGENYDAFMALELQNGTLAGPRARFYDPEVFHGLAREAVDAFAKELFA